MMNIIFRSSLFSLYSKYILPSYRNCLTDLSPRYHSLSHPYIQQCKRRFFIVFFPDYFSSAEWKKSSTENDFSFCWERFTNLQTTNHNNLLIIRYRLNKILRISPKTRKGDLFRTKREKLTITKFLRTTYAELYCIPVRTPTEIRTGDRNIKTAY